MKKGKAAKKAAIAVVTAVAVGGVSVGGYYGIRQAQKTTVKVYPVSDFTSGYWGDSMNMEGQITSTASQNIYLSDSQTISQVLVKEGDVVNAGDTLMTYDTSMIELDLETQQLQLAQTKLKIQQSEKELEKLKKTKPVSDTPLDPVEPDFPEDPDTAGQSHARAFRIFQMNPSIRIFRTNRFRPRNRSRRTRMLFCTAVRISLYLVPNHTKEKERRKTHTPISAHREQS